MAFSNSLSGLIAAGKALDVISNNIANSQTVGFKSSIARFTNVAAAGKSGSATDASSSSAGVSADNIFQQFGQGNVELSDKPLDMAISGLGFFRLYDKASDRVSFTRDGQFRLSFEGDAFPKLVTRGGLTLTGNVPNFATDPYGDIASTPAPVEISIDPVFPPRATGLVSASLNLDFRGAAPVLPFTPVDPATYNGSATAVVYDAAGGSHELRMYFAKPGVASQWEVYTTMDYDPRALPPQTPTFAGPTALNFDSRGIISTPMPLPAVSHTLANGDALSISIDFTGTTQSLGTPVGTTQFGAPFSINSVTQDGYAEGLIQDANEFDVRPDGHISARYSNGQRRNVAQLVLANFSNPNALINMGDNQWVTNDDPLKGTGTVILGFPNFSTQKGENYAKDSNIAEGMGSIRGHAREQSNVDLAAELVSLIEQQRNYQASAQTFKILDQVLQNLANMRSQ